MKKINKLTLIFLISLSTTTFIGCNNSNPGSIQGKPLEPANIYQLSVNEPSGLTYNSTTGNLYTVEDGNKGQIYEISTTGVLLRTINVDGDDMEGITINSTNDTLFVVEEGNRAVVKYTLDGRNSGRFTVFVSGASTNGLEGIAINPTTKHIFVLHEKDPRELIELTATGSKIRTIDISFADDLSGLCFSLSADKLLFVSDESKSLYEIDLDGKLLRYWEIPVEKLEGVAMDQNGLVYIVAESESKLYIFDLP